MTDQKDYTQESEVLKALGWDSRTFDGAEKWWRVGEYPTQWPTVTLSELWEGLCRAIPFNKQWAHIVGQYAVVLYYGYPEERWFLVVDHGSLTNAVAAAISHVLQQKKEE